MPIRTGGVLAAIVVIASALVLSGCTIRFSQSLAGKIPNTPGNEVRSSDSGFSFLQITFSEPTPAHEQVTSLFGACTALNKVEVDYRTLSFILFGIPKVTVTGICEQ
jgi:hypothetical protein